MGIKVYPQTAKGELERLNESLQSAADQVAPLKSGIEEYIGTSDLQSVAFASHKDYMEQGHLPALNAQLEMLQEFMEANRAHIGYINSCFPSDNHVSEDQIVSEMETLQLHIRTAEGLQLDAIADILYRRLEHCRTRLEKLRYFADATANLYQGAEAAMDRFDSYVSALEGASYNSSTQTWFLPLATNKMSNMTESQFVKLMMEQYGFDERTGKIMWDVYKKIQDKYSNLSQSERDWYFTRALVSWVTTTITKLS